MNKAQLKSKDGGSNIIEVDDAQNLGVIIMRAVEDLCCEEHGPACPHLGTRVFRYDGNVHNEIPVFEEVNHAFI